MKKSRQIQTLMVLGVFFLCTFSGCEKTAEKSGLSMENISFRDVPGVTEEEIKAVEALRGKTGSFIYGMVPGTETFRENGEIRGFTALFCGWLSELFDIPFIPALYEWDELIAGIEHGEIDFTSIQTVTGESYFITGAIAERTIKYIRIKDSISLEEIMA